MATRIRPAVRSEARQLTELAVRSKGHWGYSKDFLDACVEELTVDPELLDDAGYPCYVAVDGDTILGYYALGRVDATTCELDALFVDPPYIGCGAGRALLQHALEILTTLGVERMTIQGDPNAASFYEAAGARLVGSRESGSIPGRQLPLYEIEISRSAK